MWLINIVAATALQTYFESTFALLSVGRLSVIEEQKGGGGRVCVL